MKGCDASLALRLRTGLVSEEERQADEALRVGSAENVSDLRNMPSFGRADVVSSTIAVRAFTVLSNYARKSPAEWRLAPVP